MAVLQRNTSYTKAPPKGTFMSNLGKVGLNSALAPIEAMTGNNFYNPEVSGGWQGAMKVTDTLGKVANTAGMAVLGGMTGGLAPAVLGGIGKAVGSALPSDQPQDLVQPSPMDNSGTYIAKYGGKILTEYEGLKHEFGGIPIDATNEVEDKENSFDMKDGSKYIFSNSINMPDKKYTFAKGAKRIANKYKLREGDAMAKTAQQRELEQLSQKQEFVKEVMKTPAQRMQEQMQQQFAMGGYFRSGGEIPPTQPEIDTKLINASKSQPNNVPITSGVRFLPNGDIMPYNALKEPQYTPPTPKEIAKIMAEAEAQAKIQSQYAQKKYGGNIVPSTNDDYIPMQNSYDDGGYLNTMFDDGGKYKFKPFYNPGQDIGELPRPDMPTMNMRGLQSNPLAVLQKGTTPTYKQSMVTAATKANTPASGYKPAYGVPMAGYGIQALSNLPALFAKPNKVKFDRITPETIDLSSQRDEARRNRNLQIAMAQRQASQMDNAGQAGAYANATTSGIMGNYGDAFNQSMLQQNTTNVDIRNKAKVQNAETQMREAMVNQQELNNIREGKQQAIMNMGQAIAGAGQTYQQMGQEGNYLSAMSAANPDYGLGFSGGNFWTPQTITPYRKRKLGGKIRRKV